MDPDQNPEPVVSYGNVLSCTRWGGGYGRGAVALNVLEVNNFGRAPDRVHFLRKALHKDLYLKNSSVH